MGNGSGGAKLDKWVYPNAPEGYEPTWGLTKREYIAAAAVATLAAHLDPDDAAYEAVRYADALLAQLAKSEARA